MSYCYLADLIAACAAQNLASVREILTVPPPAGWDLANMAPNGDQRTALIVYVA